MNLQSPPEQPIEPPTNGADTMNRNDPHRDENALVDLKGLIFAADELAAENPIFSHDPTCSEALKEQSAHALLTVIRMAHQIAVQHDRETTDTAVERHARDYQEATEGANAAPNDAKAAPLIEKANAAEDAMMRETSTSARDLAFKVKIAAREYLTNNGAATDALLREIDQLTA